MVKLIPAGSGMTAQQLILSVTMTCGGEYQEILTDTELVFTEGTKVNTVVGANDNKGLCLWCVVFIQ